MFYFVFLAAPWSLIEQHWPYFVALLVGIFLSILVHELGHALAAKRYGVPVREVVIGGFYGYAALMRPARTRGQSMVVSAAGPAMNFIVFLCLWLVLSQPSLSSLATSSLRLHAGDLQFWITEAARRLAFINFLLAAFNLLPAYPLDGGRILRDVLDGFVSLILSTRIVSGLGMLIGAWMAVFGFGAGPLLLIIGIYIVLLNYDQFRNVRAVSPPR